MSQKWLAVLAMYSLANSGAAAWQEPKPAFDAASIKRNQTQRTSTGGKKTSPGRLTIDNMSFKDIIEESYGIRGYQLEGAPGWLGTELYDVVATAAGGPKSSEMELMLQTLLADRLQLKFHWAQGETQGFALTVGKNGPKFREYKSPEDGDAVNVREQVEVGKFRAPKAPMARLASYLALVLQVPVVDQTNLAGDYEIALEYSRDLKVDTDPALPPTIIAVEDQLGLKLVKQKIPVKMFVIDQVVRPSEN